MGHQTFDFVTAHNEVQDRCNDGIEKERTQEEHNRVGREAGFGQVAVDEGLSIIRCNWGCFLFSSCRRKGVRRR